mmetsp:Transcript_85052/g.227362  ORF Transcript_85052/g.227362 Transcript_85052/m.227362 type:complete len:238 (-) Transcript_85052:109-822(-)
MQKTCNRPIGVSFSTPVMMVAPGRSRMVVRFRSFSPYQHSCPRRSSARFLVQLPVVACFLYKKPALTARASLRASSTDCWLGPGLDEVRKDCPKCSSSSFPLLASSSIFRCRSADSTMSSDGAAGSEVSARKDSTSSAKSKDESSMAATIDCLPRFLGVGNASGTGPAAATPASESRCNDSTWVTSGDSANWTVARGFGDAVGERDDVEGRSTKLPLGVVTKDATADNASRCETCRF